MHLPQALPPAAGRLALAALCAATLAACGDKDEPPLDAGVRQALERFDRAQAGGEARVACRALVAIDEQGRIEVPGEEKREREEAERDAGAAKPEADADAAELEAEAAEPEADAESANPEPDGDADADAEPDAESAACERAFTRASASRRALRDVALDVTSVKVTGDRATAGVTTRLTRPDGTKLEQAASRRLVRVGGRWRVVITEE